MKISTPASRFVLVGIVFGLFMGLFFGYLYGVSGGIISGLLCAVLFGGAMYFVAGAVERKFASTTEQISAARRIIIYGPANESGNGGMLYVTETAVEFYRHKINLNTSATIINKDQVVMVKAESDGKLIVQTAQKKYTFVVTSAAVWALQCADWLKN